MRGTFKKLDNGHWGVEVQTKVAPRPGQSLLCERANGEKTTVTLGNLLYTLQRMNPPVHVFGIAKDRTEPRKPQHYFCEDCRRNVEAGTTCRATDETH